jgi:hypothetical protein
MRTDFVEIALTVVLHCLHLEQLDFVRTSVDFFWTGAEFGCLKREFEFSGMNLVGRGEIRMDVAAFGPNSTVSAALGQYTTVSDSTLAKSVT